MRLLTAFEIEADSTITIGTIGPNDIKVEYDLTNYDLLGLQSWSDKIILQPDSQSSSQTLTQTYMSYLGIVALDKKCVGERVCPKPIKELSVDSSSTTERVGVRWVPFSAH